MEYLANFQNKVQLLILSLLIANFINAQDNRNIQGSISDMSGTPIIGANVIEKGTTNGTITDIDGNFKLTVSSKAVLIISYVGYITQEVAVNNKQSFNISLKEDTGLLEEVVVVGYGTQKKRNTYRFCSKC